MVRTKERLYTITCLASVFSAFAFLPEAQAASPAKHYKSAKNAATSGPSISSHAVHIPAKAYAKGTEEIKVTRSRQSLNGGGGMMRVETAPHTVQTVTKQFISMRSPTSTALDLVKNVPSLSVSTPDTSGMQGGMIQVRGLTDLDMALMIDGAPAAAAKYMSENLDSENLEMITVTPGSSATALPAMSAAGGVLEEHTHTAARKFGGMMDFSYGTNNLSREFIRLESGEIGNSGVRSYLSFSNSHSRSWMGSGINQRHHIDFGLQKDWDNGSNASCSSHGTMPISRSTTTPRHRNFFGTRRLAKAGDDQPSPPATTTGRTTSITGTRFF